MTGNLARPERFELPTTAFEAQYSIQLSYGRTEKHHTGLVVTPWSLRFRCGNPLLLFLITNHPARFEPTLDSFEVRVGERRNLAKGVGSRFC